MADSEEAPLPRVHHRTRNPWDSDVEDVEDKHKAEIKSIWKALKDAQDDRKDLKKDVDSLKKWMWLYTGMFAVVGAIGWIIFQKVFKV